MDQNKSIELDAKYILILSIHLPLPKFEKVKDGSYKFRCVFCGDSRNHPNKRSGYFYLKGHSYNYCCFKCNHRSSLKTVLRELKPELYMEYMKEERSKRENFRDAENDLKWMDRIYKNSQTSSSDEVKDKMRKMRERRLEEKVKEQQKE